MNPRARTSRTSRAALADLARRISDCERCPRLRRHCRRAAAEPPRRFRDKPYWARPVPGFGDPAARLLVVGLAPAAHGANRTGRMFTGDRSGDFLFAALHRAGFASQAEAVDRDDGLCLDDAWITAPVRCAPPANKPTRAEQDRCRPFLTEETGCLRNLRAVLALGRIGHDSWLRHLQGEGHDLRLADAPFGHGAVHDLPDGRRLFDSYHVSQQNTFTGRLTPRRFDAVLRRVRAHLDA